MENEEIYVVIDSYHQDASTDLVTTSINKAVEQYIKYWEHNRVIEVWKNGEEVYTYEAIHKNQAEIPNEIIETIQNRTPSK